MLPLPATLISWGFGKVMSMVQPRMPPDSSRRIPFSDMIAGGKLDVSDVLQPIYDEINEQYGLQEKP